MDEGTLVLIQEVGSIVQAMGVLGLAIFMLVLFVQGRIHSDKGVERQIEPYKERLTAVDNGFSRRLENMEAAAINNEINTNRMATSLENMLTIQAESREKMTAAVTELTTVLKAMQLQSTIQGSRRKRS